MRSCPAQTICPILVLELLKAPLAPLGVGALLAEVLPETSRGGEEPLPVVEVWEASRNTEI